MIIVEAINTKPYQNKIGNAKKVLGDSLPVIIPTVLSEICICDYIKCEYIENVFAEVGGEEYKNDFSDFLFKSIISSDTITITLEKNGIKVADLNDDTLGTFFNGFNNGNSEQQKYVGFLVSWEKVLSLHGSGNYVIKAELTIAGNTTNFNSRKFFLLPYSDIAANGTVKIETTQNGNIFGSPFNFTGLEWKQYIRIDGSFGNPTPIYEESNYMNSDKVFMQTKAKMTREWSLNTRLISWEIAEKLVYNKLLANEILITNYDIVAESIWRKISVKPESLEKLELSGNPNRIYNIKFVDRKMIYEKTNY